MWITKESKIAFFKVNILPERRWSVQGKNIQLITDLELINPSLIFAVVYELPKKLFNKKFDENTPPILHVYGKHTQLGFDENIQLLQHHYTLQHHNINTNTTSGNKIYIPCIGVVQQLQFVFNNITDKPSFNNNVNIDEDFGMVEIYGFSTQKIPDIKTGISILNLSTFFHKIHNTNNDITDGDIQNKEYKLLMAVAECDTMCSYISIQSRYFNQAKELLNRSKNNWLKLYNLVSNSSKNINQRCDIFKYNILKIEILIAYISSEHNCFKSQIQSIINIINHRQNISVNHESDHLTLLPLQIICKYSHILIKTLLLTAKDNNEFMQVASFKNIYFILEKLGCNIKTTLCDILSEIFEFTNDENNHTNNDKPLHIQSIMRQLTIIKQNICDLALNLISECNVEIVNNIFKHLIIKHFDKIIKFEPTKLSYCLRIFEICIDRLHSIPISTINSSILNSLINLMYHESQTVKNISISIWKSFLYILPIQILTTNHSKEIYQWLCDMIVNTDIKRQLYFPENNNTDESNTLLKIPMIIINKMCKLQIKHKDTRLLCLNNINKLCICLKDRILSLLMNINHIKNYFDVFKLLLETLDFLSYSSKHYKIFDELIMDVLNKFLYRLKTSAPSLIMLRICIEFMEKKPNKLNSTTYINITSDILHEFHRWIPHSVNDETFILAKKLIDINYMFISHHDISLIVKSLINKYTLRSTICKELQYQFISKIYERIQNSNDNNDKNLFKLITNILIIDTLKFKDSDKINAYFDFGYDWLQHDSFETIYLDNFETIFKIIILFKQLKCNNQQSINYASDILSSITSYFGTSIHKYENNKNNLGTIVNIFNEISVFHINYLQINIGNIQFNSIQNSSLFLNAIIAIIPCLNDNNLNVIWNTIVKLLETLLIISLDSQFSKITELCLWTVCNFYYEIGKLEKNENENKQIMNIGTYDKDLIVKYTTIMTNNIDYKIRRWAGLLIFLRFYFLDNNNKHLNIDKLLMDFDQNVSEPLLQLIEIKNNSDIIKYIENNNLLHRPKSLLTSNTNIESEMLIEWDQNKINCTDSNIMIGSNIIDEVDDECDDEGDDIDIISDHVSKKCLLKNKIEIPLLPLDEINKVKIQTNIEYHNEETGMDADDERDESIEINEKHINFERETNYNNSNDLMTNIQAIQNISIQNNKINNNLFIDEDRLDTFRQNDLNTYLVNTSRGVTNRKNGWWMKYLNPNVNKSDNI